MSFEANILIILKMQAGFFPASLADIMQNGTVHLSLQTLDDEPDTTVPLKEDSSSGSAVSGICVLRIKMTVGYGYGLAICIAFRQRKQEDLK